MRWLLTPLFFIVVFFSKGEEFKLRSPNGDVEISILLTANIHYKVSFKEMAITTYSPLSVSLTDGRVLGQDIKLISHKLSEYNKPIESKGSIRSVITDRFAELKLILEGDYEVIFRAYDNGVAYRFKTDFRNPYKVSKEWIEYKFPGDIKTHAHIINTYRSSFEKHFTTNNLSELSVEKDLISPPLLARKENGPSILLTEADQSGYPGILYRRYSEENIYSLKGDHAPYPAETMTGGIKNFNQLVTKTEPFIAKMDGRSKMPWRLMIIEEDDKDLIDNTLVYQLAEASGIDGSWIRYGKVAWDWYNALNLSGVDFSAGLNTRTYKHYIDFAAEHEVEYVILDEGWSDQFDIQVPNDDMDLKELISYGKEKDVELILWSIWYPLEKNMESLFKWAKNLGVAGLKIDFFDRNDQEVMVAIEKIMVLAAENELLIDLHGCPTLAGIERTYPNLVTYEAVKGNEFVKWDEEGQPPSHNVSLAFTRNVVGPMDYTPGAMRNATQKGFSPNFESPMSNSTKAHQAGMYVVYFSPLQMLCDAPDMYRQFPEVTDMIASIPTVWDETEVLGGKYSEYAIVARRKGKQWYVGGINNESERKITLSFDFIDNVKFSARLLRDGVNANRSAGDYMISDHKLTQDSKLDLTMKEGGGFLMILEPESQY